MVNSFECMEGLPETISCVRGQIREFLERAVVGRRLDLERAKLIAKTTAEIVNEKIGGIEILEAGIGELKRQFPEIAQDLEAVRLDCEWQKKAAGIDSRVMPLVEQGKLDEALQALAN